MADVSKVLGEVEAAMNWLGHGGGNGDSAEETTAPLDTTESPMWKEALVNIL